MKLADISVVVLSRNDEDGIRRCLESVRGFGETVLVDSFSTDRTVEIAHEHPAVVYRVPGRPAAASYAWGLSRTNRAWVLALDANDEVSQALRDEIGRLDGSSADGFRFPRSNEYLGGNIRCGPRRGRGQLRLFRRSLGRFEGPDAAVDVVLDGRVGTVGATLRHTMFRDVHGHFEAINARTTATAKECVERGGWLAGILALPRMVLGPPLVFFDGYFLRLGILDGARGLIYCLVAAYESFIANAKVWESHRRRRRGESAQT